MWKAWLQGVTICSGDAAHCDSTGAMQMAQSGAHVHVPGADASDADVAMRMAHVHVAPGSGDADVAVDTAPSERGSGSASPDFRAGRPGRGCRARWYWKKTDSALRAGIEGSDRARDPGELARAPGPADARFGHAPRTARRTRLATAPRRPVEMISGAAPASPRSMASNVPARPRSSSASTARSEPQSAAAGVDVGRGAPPAAMRSRCAAMAALSLSATARSVAAPNRAAGACALEPSSRGSVTRRPKALARAARAREAARRRRWYASHCGQSPPGLSRASARASLHASMRAWARQAGEDRVCALARGGTQTCTTSNLGGGKSKSLRCTHTRADRSVNTLLVFSYLGQPRLFLRLAQRPPQGRHPPPRRREREIGRAARARRGGGRPQRRRRHHCQLGGNTGGGGAVTDAAITMPRRCMPHLDSMKTLQG